MATECGRAAAQVAYHLVTHSAHGYTQGAGREGSGWETIKYKGVTIGFPAGDADCSSMSKRVWDAVGRVVGKDLTGYATYTGNMAAGLLSTGLWVQKPMSWRANICPGDMYLTYTRGHVAIAYDHDHLCEFNRNEIHAALGGAPGDQDGLESVCRAYYNYPWDCIMHYNGPDYLADLLEDDMSKEDVAAINSRLDALNSTLNTKASEILRLLNPTSPIMPFGGTVYRLINTSTGAHTWTNSTERRDDLVNRGWTVEGEAFALGKCGDPIWCLVHPDNGEVIMTTSMNEAKSLVARNWQSEGIIGTTGEGPEVHRLYNRGNGFHLYTTSQNEINANRSAGWQDEGVQFRSA